MNKQQVIDFLEKAGIWVEDGKIAKADLDRVKSLVESNFKQISDNGSAKAGYVAINIKPGDEVRCINDKTYRRQYGSGTDWKVPCGIQEGKVYEVVKIVEDYFGNNKIMVNIDGKNVIVDTLYMDGANYGQRFENVSKPGKISKVI
jgi:hypothetical protein